MTVQTYATSWVGRRVLSDLRDRSLRPHPAPRARLLRARARRSHHLAPHERRRRARGSRHRRRHLDAAQLADPGRHGRRARAARLAARARDARRVPADGGRRRSSFRVRSSRAYRVMRERLADVTATLAEDLAGVRVIEEFDRDEHNAQLFDATSERLPRGERAHRLAERLLLPVRRAALGLRHRDRARVRRLPHDRRRDRRRHALRLHRSTCRTSSTPSSSSRWSTTRTSPRRPR